jgi:hypothetical protein
MSKSLLEWNFGDNLVGLNFLLLRPLDAILISGQFSVYTQFSCEGLE